MKLIGSDGPPPERRCDHSNMRILVIGCGYVGLPLAQTLARMGHQVHGTRRRVFRRRRYAARARCHGAQ